MWVGGVVMPPSSGGSQSAESRRRGGHHLSLSEAETPAGVRGDMGGAVFTEAKLPLWTQPFLAQAVDGLHRMSLPPRGSPLDLAGLGLSACRRRRRDSRGSRGTGKLLAGGWAEMLSTQDENTQSARQMVGSSTAGTHRNKSPWSCLRAGWGLAVLPGWGTGCRSLAWDTTVSWLLESAWDHIS